MRIPEILHRFIAQSYNPDQLKAMLGDGWGYPDAANNTTFVDDFLRRPALWLALSETNGQPDMIDFTPDVKKALADWVAEVSPDAIRTYGQSLEAETGNRHVDAENRRIKSMIQTYFPEAYEVLFS